MLSTIMMLGNIGAINGVVLLHDDHYDWFMLLMLSWVLILKLLVKFQNQLYLRTLKRPLTLHLKVDNIEVTNMLLLIKNENGHNRMQISIVHDNVIILPIIIRILLFISNW